MAFIHRFGSTLNPRLHFHCVVIDGVFDSAAAAGGIFHAAIGIDADAIAQVQAWVRRRVRRSFVHRGLCRAMTRGQWARMALAFRWTAQCASKPSTAPGVSVCRYSRSAAPPSSDRANSNRIDSFAPDLSLR